MSHQSQSPIRTPLEPRSRIVHEGRGIFRGMDAGAG